MNNLINKPTCFQFNKPTCIDLILIYTIYSNYETGISGHHKLVSTILKSGSFKGTPKMKIYRSYKKFELENFNRILKDKLENLTNHSFVEFEKVFLKELNKHAPLKKKILRHNNNVFMTKELRKEIMLRSKLKNEFNKERNHINWCNFKRQRYCCLSILRKTKKEYFNNLNIKQVSDNKLFWKSVKPFFSDKASSSSKITLVEENNIIDEEEIPNIMNNYFINVTKILNLKKQLGVGRSGINKFENHISIKMIHEKYPEILPESFKFQLVSNNEVKKEIENLDTKKSSTYGSIPATILKQCVNAYLPHLTNSINYSIQHSSFPQELKLLEVSPVYQKLNPLQKENYRPVNLLPHVSKIFERIIHKQITNYMTDKLAHSITGFRKSHGTQNSLVVMLKQWKRALDKGEYVSALFMDLSKAFDTINHDLLSAKLKAHGLSKEALKLMKSYLKNRKQKVQINNTFSSERDVIAGVPQGSIDGPLLFNLLINDLTFFIEQCTLNNYADDYDLSISGEDKELIKSMLSSDFMIVEDCFS